MTPRMGRTLTRLILGSATVGTLVLVGSPAHACSCVEMDLATRLPDAAGAFVGTYIHRSGIGQQQVAFTFEVEEVLKGDFGPTAIVRTNQTGGPCGLEFYGDRRTGLLLRRATDGVWESDLCSMVEPSQLLALGGGHPPDPEVAPVSAGLSSMSKVLLAVLGALFAVVIVGLLLRFLARQRPQHEEPRLT